MMKLFLFLVFMQPTDECVRKFDEKVKVLKASANAAQAVGLQVGAPQGFARPEPAWTVRTSTSPALPADAVDTDCYDAWYYRVGGRAQEVK